MMIIIIIIITLARRLVSVDGELLLIVAEVTDRPEFVKLIKHTASGTSPF